MIKFYKKDIIMIVKFMRVRIKMKKIIMIMYMCLFFMLLSSCSNGGATHVSGDFQYKINTKTDEVMLIGFSDEGKEKETIVLPTLIDGKKVTTIGYKEWTILSSGDGLRTSNFSGASYNNIYIHSFIIESDINSGPDIYCTSSDKFRAYLGCNFLHTDLLVTNEKMFDRCFIPDLYKNIGNDIVIPKYNSANVVYYLNYKTNIKTFFCDDCDGTKVNVIPPDPYRDGYKFLGWYKEEECINQFDFENEIIPKKEYDSNNEYIFKETSFYAKWEKSND